MKRRKVSDIVSQSFSFEYYINPEGLSYEDEKEEE
jgi:hypothetical protein